MDLVLEYLYFSHQSLTDEQALGIFNAKRISFRRAKECQALGAHGLVQNGQLAWENDQVFGLFGTAFVKNKFLNNFAARTEADTIKACRDIVEGAGNATGTFTAMIGDERSGDMEFYLDDLNSAPCFTARCGRAFAVSSNPHMLAGWMTAQGETPTRSIEPALSHMVFSSGLTTGNLFNEIAIVGPEERPAVVDGQLTMKRNDPVWPGLLDASYDELIEAGADLLRKRMTTLTETGEDQHRVFDITGGMDSRIVMAALIGAGAIEEWHFNSQKHVSHPDANYAQFVAEKYNLRRMRLMFLEKTRPSPLAKSKLDLFMGFGSEPKGGNLINACRPSLIQVTGCFGELGGKSQDTSRFLPTHANGKFKRGLLNYLPFSEQRRRRDLLKFYSEKIGLSGTKVFTGEIEDWSKRQFNAQIEGAMQYGVTLEQMPSVFYRRGKARSHFGIDAHIRGMRSQAVGVLNNPYLTAASIKVGVTQRSAGQVNFDLIRRLGGDEVAALPLADTRWKRSLFASNDDFQRFASVPISANSEQFFSRLAPVDDGPEPELFDLNPDLLAQASATEDRANGTRIWKKPLHLRAERLVRTAQSLLDEGPVTSDIYQYLTETSLRAFIATDPTQCKSIGVMVHALEFFNFAEMWSRGSECAPFTQ